MGWEMIIYFGTDVGGAVGEEGSVMCDSAYFLSPSGFVCVD